MSLLLDALKKAAKDKSSADIVQENQKLDTDKQLNPEEGQLELEGQPELDGDKQQEEHDHDRVAGRDSSVPVSESSRLNSNEDIDASQLTVSSEALQTLVHKANKQHRARQKLVWGSVLTVTIAILISGGVYFYISMIDDVETIERKHQMVMRSATDTRLSRSVIEKIERQKALEVKEIEQKVAAEKSSQQVTAVKSQAIKKKIVVKKTIKRDPVDVLVNRAWKKYEEGDYDAAESIYKKVLAREKNNRDALLGFAAISVKQGDREMAKSIYTNLVGLDPRDPVAVAALSNLDARRIDSLDESKLKLMIRKNERAPHMHFALGNIYSQQKKWPEAQQSYFSAWQNDSNNADYAFNLAVSLDQMGKQDEAKKFYQLSLDNAEASSAQFSLDAAQTRLQQLTAASNR